MYNMATNYPGNTIPILLYQNHTNIHAILSEINTLHYSSLAMQKLSLYK